MKTGIAADTRNESGLMIGVISDTHGLLRPEVAQALQGSSLIIHAGDIGSPDILSQLQGIAPVIAVRGNCDRSDWADVLPVAETTKVGSLLLHLIHDISGLDLDPAAAGIHILVSGHSHIPSVAERDGILYLNPGSAGPRRFSLPITVARIAVQNENFLPEIIRLG